MEKVGFVFLPSYLEAIEALPRELRLELFEALCTYGVEGVENYRILSPESDLEGKDTVLPMLGTLTVTEMEA